MSKRIILIGSYGGHDIGDEAMPTTIMINFKKFIPDAQFLALSPDPEYTSKYHKVESDYHTNHYLFSFPKRSSHIISKLYKVLIVLLRALTLVLNAWLLRKNKKAVFINSEGLRLLNNLKSADILFNVGGGNLNSLMRVELYSKGLTYLVCKILGKPIILSGQTIGPINNWLDKKIAGFFLNKVDVITLRDINASIEVLKSIGVTKPTIKETVDDALLLPPASSKRTKTVFLNEKIREDYPLVIGMNANAYLKDVTSAESYRKKESYNQILADVADRLASELGAKIVFIPMEYNPMYDDRIAASEVLKLMKRRDKVSIIKGEYDDHTLKGLIGQMNLVIGLRYHFVIFATTMGVPTIGIYLGKYYKMKIRGILELMEQEKYARDFEKTSSEEIVGLVKNALQNKDEIKKKLEERTKILGERSLFTIEYAAKLLGKKR